MRRQLQFEITDENAGESRKRGELIRAVFSACWKRREEALRAQGKSELDAERESAREAEAIVHEVFPDAKWVFRIVRVY